MVSMLNLYFKTVYLSFRFQIPSLISLRTFDTHILNYCYFSTIIWLSLLHVDFLRGWISLRSRFGFGDPYHAQVEKETGQRALKACSKLTPS